MNVPMEVDLSLRVAGHCQPENNCAHLMSVMIDVQLRHGAICD